MFIEAGGLIYNPYAALDDQISSVSNGLTGIFDEIDTALEKGRRIRDAVAGDRIDSVLRSKLAYARMSGFLDGAKYSKARMPVLYGKHTSRAAARRALKVNDWMNRTTRRMLKRTPDSEHVLSSDRGLSAARYELGRAYFKGVGDAYEGNRDFQKKWMTSDGGDVCPDCLLAEDEGRIAISAEYDNGFMFPPGHLNCGCWIVITRFRIRKT